MHTKTNYQIMPDLSDEEYQELKSDIASRGVMIPIEYDELGNILDGHHRFKICEELNITDFPKVIRAGMNEGEKRIHARKLNIARRHLTQEQRQALIREQLTETPEKSDRQIASGLGVSNSTVSITRKEMVENNQLCDSHSSIGADGKERPREVSHNTITIFNPTPKEEKAIQDSDIIEKLLDGTAKNINDAITQQRHELIKQKFETVPDTVSGGRVIEGDLFDKIAEIPDSSVDLLFADPPYMILDEKWDKYENVAHFMEFTQKWLDAVLPKVKDTGRVYISFSQYYQFDLYDLLREHNFYGFNFGQVIIWNYRNNNKPSDKKLYRFAYEPVFYLYGKQADVLNFPPETYGETQTNVWDIATPQSNFSEGKFHPAQKPLELLERIILTGSKDGNTVLDPFAGSGTTGVAAQKLNRNFILIEKEQEYCRIAKGRLNVTEVKL